MQYLLEYRSRELCIGCGRESGGLICDDCRKWKGYFTKGTEQRSEFFVAAWFGEPGISYRVMTPDGLPFEGGTFLLFEYGVSLGCANYLCRELNRALQIGEILQQRKTYDLQPDAINNLINAAVHWKRAQDGAAGNCSALMGNPNLTALDFMDDAIEQPLYLAARVILNHFEGREPTAGRLRKLEKVLKFARRIIAPLSATTVDLSTQVHTDFLAFCRAVSALDDPG